MNTAITTPGFDQKAHEEMDWMDGKKKVRTVNDERWCKVNVLALDG